MEPKDITAENADEAVDQLIAEMKSLSTKVRRIHEVSSALAARTGNPEDRTAASQAEIALIEIDKALQELLKARDES